MKLARVEQLNTALLDEINGVGDDYQRLHALAADLDHVNAAVDMAMTRWVELAAVAEGG